MRKKIKLCALRFAVRFVDCIGQHIETGGQYMEDLSDMVFQVAGDIEQKARELDGDCPRPDDDGAL